ncbi:MAG: GNAT family N-acetyltransferase [Spirochaetaceae bacterium]|nr:GNAT family N-acetyltransferase [Spirochaetaceae bacterium]
MADLELAFAPRMAAIDRAEWDALALPYGNPLLSWGFLALLEESGSIVPERGWTPSHLLLRRGGRLVAAAPFYVKTSSAGEFVFDYELAELARELGGRYYPKLVGMVPATPSPAWRVLVAPGEDEAALAALVVDGAAEAARGAGLSGLHLQWVAEDLHPLLRVKRGFAEWQRQSFLWSDSGARGEPFGDFPGYLAAFSKNMRRNVGRERAGLAAAGVTSRVIGAEEAAAIPGLLGRMADYYGTTNDKFGPWAARFLERDFFLRLPEFLPKGWLLAAGYEAGAAPNEPLGLAFLFEGRERLYGRYWGAARAEPGLHFELCYYAPIEYALARGLKSFDPGMGSEHKARRGFRSRLASSFHLVFDRRLARVLAEALPAANAAAAAEARELDFELPFKES